MLLLSIFPVLLYYEMLHTIFIKCKVDVMYFIFIFISSSVPRFSVKKSINQLIKNKRPKARLQGPLLIVKVASIRTDADLDLYHCQSRNQSYSPCSFSSMFFVTCSFQYPFVSIFGVRVSISLVLNILDRQNLV